MTQREKVVDIAKEQVGYYESSNGYTKFGEWYDNNYGGGQGMFTCADWCAMFCGWCQSQAGVTSDQTVFTASAGDTGVSLYKQKNMWHDSDYIPNSGDLIHFTWGHVGIVNYVSDGCVYTIEGNYSDSVAQNCYSLDYDCIRGYAVPKYSDEENENGDGEEMNFKLNDKSDGVLAVKGLLNTAYIYGIIKTDAGNGNEYDERTETAAKEFQTAYKLDVDGIVGNETAEKLKWCVERHTKDTLALVAAVKTAAAKL